MLLSIYLSFILSIGAAADAPESFELSQDQKECFSFSANIKRKPKALALKTNIDEEFLQSHPICQTQLSCLGPDRLQLIKEKGLLPGPSGVTSKDPGSRISEKNSPCPPIENLGKISGLRETSTTLFSKAKILPKETNLAHKLIADTKGVVTNYLELSKKANDVLSECFTHNEVMEKNGIPFQQRLQKAANDSRIPKACARIWGPESPMPAITQKNKELRQTLALIELVDKGGFENSEQVFDLCSGINEDKVLTPFYKDLLSKKMSPPKAKFFGQKVPGELWEGTPDQIEGLNDFERKGLTQYLIENFELDKSPASIRQLKTALSARYFQLLNENPILREFSSARPSATEFKNAFQANQRKIQNLGDQKMTDDVDYLNFPAALSQAIESAPPEQRGDLCVLAHEMIQGRRNFKEAPGNIAIGLMAVESFGAASVARGVAKKIQSFLFGARYSGTAYQALMINDGINEIRSNTEVCLKTGMDSNGLCRTDVVQKSSSDTMLNAVLMGAFSMSKKPMKVLLPLAIPSDQVSEQKK